MNRYGRLAYDHTRLHRPRAFAAMADPAAHFTALGLEVECQITELRDRLLGAPGAGESLEDYRRRSYQARRQAEEVVLAEAVWTAPEPATETEDDEVLASRSQLAAASRVLASLDRDWTATPAEAPTPP